MKKLLYLFSLLARGLVILLLVFLVADYLAPLDINHFKENKFARLVVAQDGTPLRAFADEQGIWRYPVTLEQVSPRYINTLLSYEDRWFWYHPGVNPLAMVRAAVQNIVNGKVISGGSTLTMQVARIIDPHNRTLTGKLKQVFRALQLEWHHSKEEILTLYLNFAPFGGPVEGVQAASYAYLNKPARELTLAEAALLSVLPQSPTRFRPDKHPERAIRARNKVLERLYQFGQLSREQVDDAKLEVIVPQLEARPMIAPILTRRLKTRVPRSGVLKTTLDYNLQQQLESLVKAYTNTLAEKSSVAVLVVDHHTMQVKAYVGSADFFDRERQGQVDMIRSVRSPGSTLKPFLYAMALDQGLVTSHSMLMDKAINVDGYKPQNFSRQFTGNVSLSEALQRSLNIPAVQVLQFLGAGYFQARLENAGLKLYLPKYAQSNLSVILGGAGIRLEQLVRAYTAFSRGGRVSELIMTLGSEQEGAGDDTTERYLMSSGAAWIIHDILSKNSYRKALTNRFRQAHQLAWKTGTSYGFRDAWAMGITKHYTIGVWTGRADATPVPGQSGARTAIPLLNEVVQVLPLDMNPDAGREQKPETVTQEIICWPGGLLKTETPPEDCYKTEKAWVLDQTVPPTLASNPNLETSLKTLKITTLDDGSFFSAPPGKGTAVTINLATNHNSNGLYWFVNGKALNHKPVYHGLSYVFKETGTYQVNVIDRHGRTDQVTVHVKDPATLVF